MPVGVRSMVADLARAAVPTARAALLATVPNLRAQPGYMSDVSNCLPLTAGETNLWHTPLRDDSCGCAHVCLLVPNLEA